MDLQVPEAALASVLLATARTAGFIILAPPFNSKAISAAVKGALAVALGRGAALEEALRLGAAAGAANFLRRGLGSATREFVEELAGQVVVRDYAG